MDGGSSITLPIEGSIRRPSGSQRNTRIRRLFANRRSHMPPPPASGATESLLWTCLLWRVYFRGLSTFEGLTCPQQHVINARFAPSPVTGSVCPLPRLAGREPNPTRPSSALLFNVLQWKRVRNSGHALTRRRVNRRPGDGARQQAVLDTYLIPQRSSYRRTLLCAPGWPPPYPWDADFAGCLCPSLL
jgi:hypothetical protein